MQLATPFTEAILGKTVSHVWRGHRSALFLEFGMLTPRTKRNGDPGNACGQISLMIEWGWRIERPRSILGGCWSEEKRWPGMFKQLLGSKVDGVEFIGRLPEIVVLLSNGLRVVSFMPAEGQPQWTLLAHSPALGDLSVKRGRLYLDPPQPAFPHIGEIR
ncbi:hypothetical protein JHS3_16300 [Jeongeupia sp. HS-3]|nr:hypothetical protein JHS3_16300 [Jeongeupia sp. HS-3]